MTSEAKLLGISSEAIASSGQSPRVLKGAAGASGELARLLERRNGFVAFESALLVLPGQNAGQVPGLDEWNDPRGWRKHYREVVSDDVVFFAMDALCCQFGTTSSAVVHLDPESGSLTTLSSTLEEWAALLLADYEQQTAWPLCKAWQAEHGPLGPGQRLIPLRPFVLGGDFEADNLRAMACGPALELLGRLYAQIKSAPDGSQVTVDWWPQHAATTAS